MEKELAILSLIYTHLVNTPISLQPYLKKSISEDIKFF